METFLLRLDSTNDTEHLTTDEGEREKEAERGGEGKIDEKTNVDDCALLPVFNVFFFPLSLSLSLARRRRRRRRSKLLFDVSVDDDL